MTGSDPDIDRLLDDLEKQFRSGRRFYKLGYAAGWLSAPAVIVRHCGWKTAARVTWRALTDLTTRRRERP